MPYFKDDQSRLHFLSDVDLTNGGLRLLPPSVISVSDKDAEKLFSKNEVFPITIQMWQARAALDELGLLDDADAAVAASGSPAIRQYWQYATTLDEGNDFTKAFAAVIGLTEKQMHDLFVAASEIKLSAG